MMDGWMDGWSDESKKSIWHVNILNWKDWLELANNPTFTCTDMYIT